MSTKDASAGQRRPTFTEAARKAQLIECAIETIATLGYAQASLAHIAQRAEISKSVITYYFSSKEELIKQVVTAIFQEAGAYIGPLIAAQPTPRPRLHAYIRSHVEYITTHLQQMMAIAEIVRNARTKEGKLHYGAAIGEPMRAPLETLLRNGQQAGEFREFDVRVMAGTIRAAIDVLSPLFIANPHLDADLYAGELATLFDLATRKE